MDATGVVERALIMDSLPSALRFLKTVMEAEVASAEGGLGFLAIAVHGVLLESGFVARGNRGAHFPGGWSPESNTISLRYTTPDLLVEADEDAKTAVLKLSGIRNYASVYGYVKGDRSYVHRVCLDVEKLMPSLISFFDVMTERQEKEVVEFCKVVKDGLCLPLSIDLCENNGLPLPPCFSRLPLVLKTKILELLHGVDLACVSGVCSELRFLSSDDQLWKHKFEEEFGVLRTYGSMYITWRAWKLKFARSWQSKKRDKGPDSVPQVPRPHGIAYDLHPASFASSVCRLGSHQRPARR